MDEILRALQSVLDKADDAEMIPLEKALREYGTRYHGSRRRMIGSIDKLMDIMEQECGYRYTCRECDGEGVTQDHTCSTCNGEGVRT